MEDQREGRFFEHFSHGHLLVLGDPPPEGNPVCYGCKTTIFPAKSCYMCRKCPFFLHQVCFGMPKSVQHPVDPHPLALLSMPSSLKNSADCKACGQSISTFYYSCVDCRSFYHVLCLAMPLSLKVPSHPHTLTLEFSPPYDFQCDLCARPSYAACAAWLYHCSLCEFDVHISCAITNRGAQFLHESVDDCGRLDTRSKRHELMELLSRGINNHRQETPAKLEDMATPSYQFSDACFSIDFAKSLLDDEKTGREENPPVHGGKTTTGGYVNLPKQPTTAAAHHHHHHHHQAQRPSLDSMSESSKKELNVKISSPISSRVWMELDPETKKDFQTQKSQNVSTHFDHFQ